MSRLFCWVGWHRHSRDKATYDGITFNSACERCGAPMTRLESGKWVLTSQSGRNTD